jgi:cytochrome c5
MIHRLIAGLFFSFLFLAALMSTHLQLGTISINAAQAAEATTPTKAISKRTKKTPNANAAAEPGGSCTAQTPEGDKVCSVRCKAGQSANCEDGYPPKCKCD